MNYLLGSGYFHKNPHGDTFLNLWNSCIERYADPAPKKRVILSVGNSWPWTESESQFLHSDIINLGGNLGHVDALLAGNGHAYCGWTASFLALALIAYNAEKDFVYLEQDCLAFGPWVQRAYADMGGGDMVFGAKMKTAPHMPCAQALVLVRHSFIPTMVAMYLACGTDANVNNLPEHKFVSLERRLGPERIKRLSFGVDRMRPIPWDDEVFYFQQPTATEIEEVKRRRIV